MVNRLPPYMPPLGHTASKPVALILPPSYTIEEIEELEKKYQATTGQSQKESLTTCGFTQNDRKVLHQIQQVAVYGNNPTDSQRAGNIRHRQVLYGAARYQPASGKNRGYSADRAATDAIKATEFKNKPGAYTIAEKSSLAQAIRREYNKERGDSATSHTKM